MEKTDVFSILATYVTRMAGIEPAYPFGNKFSKLTGYHCPTSAYTS